MNTTESIRKGISLRCHFGALNSVWQFDFVPIIPPLANLVVLRRRVASTRQADRAHRSPLEVVERSLSKVVGSPYPSEWIGGKSPK